MRKIFVKNILLLLLINLIVKPVWIFGIDRNVQNAVGHREYGLYQALLNLSLIFQVFLDFGLQQYNGRMIAQSPNTIRNTFPNILAGKGLLSLVYFGLLILIGVLFGYRGHTLGMLAALGLVQVMASFLLYLRSNVSGLQHYKTDSILSVLDRFLMIVVCSAGLFMHQFAAGFTIEWFIYAQIFAYSMTAVIALFFVLKYAHLRKRSGKVQLNKVWVIFRQSLPYAVLIFVMALYLRIDVPLLEKLLPLSPDEAGKYAAAYRLLDAANNITGVLVAGMLLPLFSNMLAGKTSVYPIVKMVTNILLPLSLFCIILCAFMGQEIMGRLYLHTTAGDGRLLLVLMGAFPGFCIGYIYATLITAAGRILPLIKISLIALGINLTSNLLLIPAYGALGAAFSAMLTQWVLMVLNLVLAKNLVMIKIDRNIVFRYLLFIVISVSVVYACNRFIGNWLLRIGIDGMGFLALVFCLGLLEKPSALLALLKKPAQA